jgi:hypothetical protein
MVLTLTSSANIKTIKILTNNRSRGPDLNGTALSFSTLDPVFFLCFDGYPFFKRLARALCLGNSWTRHTCQNTVSCNPNGNAVQ